MGRKAAEQRGRRFCRRWGDARHFFLLYAFRQSRVELSLWVRQPRLISAYRQAYDRQVCDKPMAVARTPQSSSCPTAHWTLNPVQRKPVLGKPFARPWRQQWLAAVLETDALFSSGLRRKTAVRRGDSDAIGPASRRINRHAAATATDWRNGFDLNCTWQSRYLSRLDALAACIAPA